MHFQLKKIKIPKYKTFFKKFHFIQNENYYNNYDNSQKSLLVLSKKYRNVKLANTFFNFGFFAHSLNRYVFEDRAYNNNRKIAFYPSKVLSLNFSRNKFFPVLRSLKGPTYFFLSLGFLSKFLMKGKAFTKTKPVFILLASFLRKVLLFSSLTKLYLFVHKTPLYFKEIMSTINDAVVNVYKDPFGKTFINEKKINNPFSFPLIFFTNNKSYGFMKTKQRGRLKRKISKRLTTINRGLD